MTTEQRAMLGDKEAQRQITERGELLPCPFCGGQIVIWDSDFGVVKFAECKKCEIRFVFKWDNTNKEIAEKWDTRAPILTMEQINALEAMEHETDSV